MSGLAARKGAPLDAVDGALPASGDVGGLVGRQQEDTAEAEYAARLALVARHTNSGVSIADGDGVVEWVNEGFTQITGYAAAEVVGRRHRDLYKGPFTRTPEFDEIFATLDAGRSVVGEYPFRAKGGRPYWVSIEALPISEGGRVVRQIWVERDVTSRRRAEDHVRESVRRTRAMADELARERTLLANVLGTIPHLVFWKNTSLRYVGCNNAFLAFRGLTEGGVIGRLERELDVTDELTPVLAELERQVLQTTQPVSGVKVTASGASGVAHSLLLSVLPQCASWGEAEGVIGVAADVTHVTALERQLAQATRLESIGQLAAGIAHEINTPVQYVNDNNRFVADSFAEVLAAVVALSALVRQAGQCGTADVELVGRMTETVGAIDLDFLGVEVPGALAQSAEGLDRVTQIVRAMKDFSHPGQGRSETDLNRTMDSTVQVSRSEWKYVAEVECDFDPAVGIVSCYEGELKQTVLNIVVNAAHAIGEQRGRDSSVPMGHIRLRTRRERDTVRIEIADDGPGMDGAVQERIFDPFFTTKEVGKGTGQGLSMAMNSVRKHGGTIGVRSAPGEGATFTIILPLDVADPPRGAPGE